MLNHSKEILFFVYALMAPLAKGDSVIFSENFDTEPTGLSKKTLTNWTVANAGSGGSVDLFGHGLYGLPCAGNAGRCLDLDGTTSAAADLISKVLTLPTGTYTLSYRLAGSQRGDSNTVDVFFDETLLRTVTLDSSAPYTTFSDVFNVSSSTSGSIEFSHFGSDRKGLLLDSIVLTQNVVSGDAAWAQPPYNVKCKNNTTSQTVTIRKNEKSTYDCEKSGLVVNSGDNVTVTITGVKK